MGGYEGQPDPESTSFLKRLKLVVSLRSPGRFSGWMYSERPRMRRACPSDCSRTQHQPLLKRPVSKGFRRGARRFVFGPNWLPSRYKTRTNHPKTVWERTPYYTRTYSKQRVFIRGKKPQELAHIARITTRQWAQHERDIKRDNPVLKGLRWLRVFEDESPNSWLPPREARPGPMKSSAASGSRLPGRR